MFSCCYNNRNEMVNIDEVEKLEEREIMKREIIEELRKERERKIRKRKKKVM